jgi:hypothetical protein
VKREGGRERERKKREGERETGSGVLAKNFADSQALVKQKAN